MTQSDKQPKGRQRRKSPHNYRQCYLIYAGMLLLDDRYLQEVDQAIKAWNAADWLANFQIPAPRRVPPCPSDLQNIWIPHWLGTWNDKEYVDEATNRFVRADLEFDQADDIYVVQARSPTAVGVVFCDLLNDLVNSWWLAAGFDKWDRNYFAHPALSFTYACIFYDRSELSKEYIAALFPDLPNPLQELDYDPNRISTNRIYRYYRELSDTLMEGISRAIDCNVSLSREDLADLKRIAETKAMDALKYTPPESIRYLRLFPGTMSTDLQQIEADARIFADRDTRLPDIEDAVRRLVARGISPTRMERYLPYSRTQITEIAKRVRAR